jgi:hypothetical protein
MHRVSAFAVRSVSAAPVSSGRIRNNILYYKLLAGVRVNLYYKITFVIRTMTVKG